MKAARSGLAAACLLAASLATSGCMQSTLRGSSVGDGDGQYLLSGDRALMPATIYEDGAKTYILWDENQPMPAVFGIGPSGDEEMVDGHMRAGVFTIDRVYHELVFRIDREKAVARHRVGSGR